MFTSLIKKNILFTHSIWYLIFLSGWRRRIILSIIPRSLIIVLKRKSKRISIQELWLSSIYKNLIKAGFYLKKTSMCSLLKFQVLIIKDNVFTHRSKVKRFFLPPKKERDYPNLYIYNFYAKLLQSCPTLCDPIDGSPPGSIVPGILQARTLEWVAISFSNAWKWSRSVVSDS